jgi:hypothetical protein
MLSNVAFSVKGAAKHLVLSRWLLQTPRPLSTLLERGEEWTGIADAKVVREGLAEIAPDGPPWEVVVTAQAGNRAFRGEPIDFTRGPGGSPDELS